MSRFKTKKLRSYLAKADAMAVEIKSGQFQCSEFMPDEVLTLIHGGAGPADPQGEKLKRGLAALERIHKEFSNKESLDQEFSPFLTGPLTPQTVTEKVVLSFVKALEYEPLFNAGRGAALQEDGVIRLSAGFMESERQKFSAVMNVENVLHPSELAYALQMKRFCVLDSKGSQNLAREYAVPFDDLTTKERFERWAEFKRQSLEGNEKTGETGTVGCVSVSPLGHLAAATSTGGVSNETPGRIGDTPTVAGNYCSKKVAVSCTGVGEQIVHTAFAARVSTRVEDGLSLNEALEKSLNEADQLGYRLAAIAVHFNEEARQVAWAAGSANSSLIWRLVTPPDLEQDLQDEAAADMDANNQDGWQPVEDKNLSTSAFESNAQEETGSIPETQPGDSE